MGRVQDNTRTGLPVPTEPRRRIFTPKQIALLFGDRALKTMPASIECQRHTGNKRERAQLGFCEPFRSGVF